MNLGNAQPAGHLHRSLLLRVLTMGVVASVVRAQEAPTPPITVHIEACMGSGEPWILPPLLRGAPLEIAVSLGNAAALRRADDELLAMNAARAARAAGREPDPRPTMPPMPEESLALPLAGAGWIDALTVTLERLDAAGEPETAVPADMIHAAFLADDLHRSPEPVLSGRGPVTVLGQVPVEDISDLTDGHYRISVVFDTRSSTEPGVWKGRVEAKLGPLVLRNPASVRERCDVAYRNLCRASRREDRAAQQGCLETLLVLDPSYRNFEAWADLGNLRDRQGDADGACDAWLNYVRLATHNPNRDDMTGYEVRIRLGAVSR
jgi:hypothetical protein